MAQADGVVANGTGSAVRSDINNQYAALWSNHSGSTEPSSGKVAYQFWADTNTSILKIRNSANNAWINLFTLAGGIDVDAASNFNEDVTFTGASYNLVWDKSDNALEFADNAKCTFGTGGDLEIYHDGSTSRLHSASDSLYIRTGNIFAVYDGAGNEEIIRGIQNGAVELYFDGSAHLTTTAAGGNLDGVWDINNGLKFYDTIKAQFGTGNDLEIFHNGSHSFIQNGTGNLYIWGADGHDGNIVIQATYGEESIWAKHNGAVELYYDNSKKFETTSTGTKTTGINLISGNVAGSYIAQIVHDGNNTDRYGLTIHCGADDASGTNYAIGINDGDGTGQGFITFSGGTVTYGTFTAHHPCIVPDSENPSDSSNAYPYGTLLETISIEYTQKNGSDTERGIRYKVQKTQSANSRKVLGAYGSSMNGGPDGQTNEHQALVLGDGHILVNNAGGNIEIGDGICSSATAGIGQKATANPSMIIGIAQEAVTFTSSETKLVAVQYGLQQFIPWT